MPNLITHYYFANELKKSLSGKALETIEKEPEAFNLGAMGPDFLFTLRELGAAERLYPNTMQYTNTFEVFDLTAKYLRENPNDIQLSYILGVLCHYVADFHTHPFVNFFVEKVHSKHLPLNQQSNIHGLIELAIDSHICEEKYNLPSHKFKAGMICKAKKNVRIEIGRLYENVINKIFGYETKAKKFATAFYLTQLFMWFTVDKHNFKKKIFDKFEQIKGGKKKLTGLMRPPEGFGTIDYMNRNKIAWLKVRNGQETSNESIDELFERASKSAIRYINNYIDYIDGKKPLDRKDFAVNYEGVKTE